MKTEQERTAAAEDGAAYWFARMQSDSVPACDHREFERWLAASPDNEAAWSECQAFWDFAGQAAGDGAIAAMRKEALALGPEPRRAAWPQWQGWTAIAAALVAILSAGVLLLSLQQPESGERSPAFAQAPSSDARLFRTAVGQHSTITLEDGSSVELNADSLLRVDYSDGRRQLALLHGQALFDVAHDPGRPFVVAAGGQRIVALGTSFDVRLRSGEMRVTLIEGEIAVERVEEDSERTPEVRHLTAGQQLVAAGARPFEIRAAAADEAVGWRTGRLLFSDEPLGDVVEEVNLYSHKKVVLADPALRDLRVSGVFRVGATDGFANALELTFPVETEREADGDVIVRWR